jgi:glutamine amidotransferase
MALTESPPRVAVLDYGMGNLHSVQRAFSTCGAAVELVRRPEEMDSQAALVFPGQGAIVDTISLLQSSGWDQFITDWISRDQPFFGICLGLQALFEHSEEGDTPGLGIFPGRVRRFHFPAGSPHKVPHMGWNTVQFTSRNTLLDGLDSSSSAFYFVHSFFVDSPGASFVWGSSQHGDQRFVSAIRQGRLVATQFHPEKSQSAGLTLYRNFISSLNS